MTCRQILPRYILPPLVVSLHLRLVNSTALNPAQQYRAEFHGYTSVHYICSTVVIWNLLSRMFQDFSSEYFEMPTGITIHARIGGEGPPVLLFHGYPETSACWNAVALELIAAGYSVVVPDLRGYGASSKPSSSKNHETGWKMQDSPLRIAVSNTRSLVIWFQRSAIDY